MEGYVMEDLRSTLIMMYEDSKTKPDGEDGSIRENSGQKAAQL
jgi:hypothetical protein